MKRLILSTICIPIFVVSLFAQNEGITIGDSNETLDGTIRYNNATGFEGLHLGNWLPFTGTNTASPWTVSGTNIYYDGTGNVGIGGLSTGSKLHVNGPLLVNEPGSSTGQIGISSPLGTPGLIFLSNDDLFRADIRRTVDGLHFATHLSTAAPATRMVLTNDGRLGIGTTAPVSILDVNNSFYSATGTVVVKPQNSTSEGGELVLLGSGLNNEYRIDNFDGTLRFFQNGQVTMFMQPNGHVAIGPANAVGGYKLYVAEGILTERVKIATMGSAEWSDYVFEEDYELKSLHEIKQFVQQNKHLPNIPSAQEIEKSGYELQQMDAKLLEKIEELYLLTIQLNEEKQQIEATNKKLDAENKSLKATQQDILKRLSKLEKTH